MSSNRGRRSALPKFTPKPINTPKKPAPKNGAAATPLPPTSNLPPNYPPPGDYKFREEAVRQMQEKYDADAAILAEKKRLKRLEELEKKLPTEMEGRILASGESGGAIYAKKQHQQQASQGEWMPISAKEKEEQRRRAIRNFEIKYQDAKMEAEKQKLVDDQEKKRQRMLELAKVLKHGQVLDVQLGTRGHKDEK